MHNNQRRIETQPGTSRAAGTYPEEWSVGSGPPRYLSELYFILINRILCVMKKKNRMLIRKDEHAHKYHPNRAVIAWWTGENLTRLILEGCEKLRLDLNKHIGQIHVCNTSGQYNGVRSRIRHVYIGMHIPGTPTLVF